MKKKFITWIKKGFAYDVSIVLISIVFAVIFGSASLLAGFSLETTLTLITIVGIVVGWVIKGFLMEFLNKQRMLN